MKKMTLNQRFRKKKRNFRIYPKERGRNPSYSQQYPPFPRRSPQALPWDVPKSTGPIEPRKQKERPYFP